jgi:hypothetical protein
MKIKPLIKEKEFGSANKIEKNFSYKAPQLRENVTGPEMDKRRLVP